MNINSRFYCSPENYWGNLLSAHSTLTTRVTTCEHAKARNGGSLSSLGFAKLACVCMYSWKSRELKANSETKRRGNVNCRVNCELMFGSWRWKRETSSFKYTFWSAPHDGVGRAPSHLKREGTGAKKESKNNWSHVLPLPRQRLFFPPAPKQKIFSTLFSAFPENNSLLLHCHCATPVSIYINRWGK